MTQKIKTIDDHIADIDMDDCENKLCPRCWCFHRQLQVEQAMESIVDSRPKMQSIEDQEILDQWAKHMKGEK